MQKFKVLLVDDEEVFVTTLSERLQMPGLEPHTAFDGEQALELVREEAPDVMVLDLKMPGIQGMEVLRWIKSQRPDVQVAIVTGHGSEKDEEEARRLGAFDYLRKPVEFEDLVEVLKRAYHYKATGSGKGDALADA